VPVRFTQPLAPRRIDSAQGSIDRMAEFVNGNALIVIAVQGQVQQVLFAEAGDGQAAGSAHALV
jgi:hypothetical protein